MTPRPILPDEVPRFHEELNAPHWLGHRRTGQVLRDPALPDPEWLARLDFAAAVASGAARDRP